MIQANGFFKEFLQTQLSGLTGHIEEAGYPFNVVKWGNEDYYSTNGCPLWWVYEQTGYHLDGYLRCGIALNDKNVIDDASRMIYNVINNPDEDGYLGPKFMKYTKDSDGHQRWAHVVFFRACLALYEYNKDNKIIDAITKHYVNSDIDLSGHRDVLNVEIMCNLYGINNNPKLLEKAVSTYDKFNNETNDPVSEKELLSDRKPYGHGVTYNEFSKLGCILYKYTGNEKYLKTSIKSYKKVDRYNMLPSFCNCSSEYLFSNYYMDSYETCDISDYTWSLSYLLKITKKHEYGDKIERCIFNAGIGSVLENFRGLQYFSCSNQVILDNKSNHNLFFKGSKWMSYRPNPGTECCPGNVNRFMPNYCLNMYSQEGDNIYCNLFGASTFKGKIKDNNVVINQITDYPFQDNIIFKIETNDTFNLFLRNIGFAEDLHIFIDEKEVKLLGKEFFKLKINKNCIVKYNFKTKIEFNYKNNGVFFTKGPLVYSFGTIGKRIIDEEEERSSKEFPAYNMYFDGDFGYVIDDVSTPKFIDGTRRNFKIEDNLQYIEVKAYKIKNLKLKHLKKIKRMIVDPSVNKFEILKGDYYFTPDVLKENVEIEDTPTTIKLYPYGACKLRMTVMPLLNYSHNIKNIEDKK